MKRKERKNKRRLAAILRISVVAAILAFGMAGCSSSSEQSAEEPAAAPAAEQSAESEANAASQEETTGAATEASQTEESGTTKATRAQEQTKATTKASKKSTTKAKKSETTKKPAQATKTAKNEKKSTTKKQTKNTTRKATKKPTTKATQANVCYVTVEGYCSGKSVSLQGGDTAYSVLKQSGASVSAEKSQYGLYVKGINGRFEFDEGPASGWKYSVNGSTPSKAADKCGISKGDVVKWYYVK